MSHTTRFECVESPWFYNAYVVHNADWSGEARIKWYRRISEGESKSEEIALPGAIVKALIAHVNRVGIDNVRDLLTRLENGK